MSVYGSEEYVDMVREFQASGSFDKMNEIYMIFCVSDDMAEQLLAEEEDEDLRDALRILLFNAEKVSRDYQSEKIILLLYPDEEFINKTLKAAGLEGDYVMNKNAAPDGHLEIFAFTKRTVRDRTYTYRYYSTCDEAVTSSGEYGETDPTKLPDENATVVSGDRAIIYDDNGNIIGSQDVTVTSSDKREISGPDDSDNILFDVALWRNFYNWAAGIYDSVKEHEAEASAIEIYLAAEMNDITKLADAQVETLTYPINKSNYSPWSNIDGCKVDVKRISSVVISIYSCHSYKYGHDYYLLKTTASTTPRNYQDRTLKFTWKDDSFHHDKKWDEGNMTGHKDPVNYLSGFTGALKFDSYIMLGTNSDLTAEQVTLIDHYPPNVAKQKTVSKGMSWNLGGKIGYNQAQGVIGEINTGVSYTNNESWTVKDYEVIDHAREDKDASVSWKVNFPGVSEGAWHLNGLYSGINPASGTTSGVEFKCEWIWKIEKSIWSKAGDKLPMMVKLHNQEGFAFGGGTSMFPPYSWETTQKWPWFDLDKTFYLNMPAHHWLSKRIFSFTKAAKNAEFNLLSEGKWTVSTKADWLHLSTTGGEATGENEFQVVFYADENNTGAIRNATIEFVTNIDGREEKQTVQVTQSAI